MKIANPLNEHAFKYLMSNYKLARKVLSAHRGHDDHTNLRLSSSESGGRPEGEQIRIWKRFKLVVNASCFVYFENSINISWK